MVVRPLCVFYEISSIASLTPNSVKVEARRLSKALTDLVRDLLP